MRVGGVYSWRGVGGVQVNGRWRGCWGAWRRKSGPICSSGLIFYSSSEKPVGPRLFRVMVFIEMCVYMNIGLNMYIGLYMNIGGDVHLNLGFCM